MNTNTILIIEDELAILNNICTILEISGYNCIKAKSGLLALQLLETTTPDLILCDVMMPEMTGFEVLEKLRENAKTKTLLFCLRWIDRSGRLSNYKMKIIWIYKKKMFSRRIHCILQEGWKLG